MKAQVLSLLLYLFIFHPGFAETTNHHNVYLSYVSTTTAQSIAHYLKEKHLGGITFWELRGDTGFNEDGSLLKTINTVLSDYDVSGEKPFIIGYWSNRNTYSKDQPAKDASYPPYAIPGSRDIHGNTLTNLDFNQKINGINILVYRSLQAQTELHTYYDDKIKQWVTIKNKTPDAIGTLYLSDPWSDLSSSGAFATQDTFCRNNAAICDFSLVNRKDPIELEFGAKMGNFNAFINLEHLNKNNPLGPLRKLVSVGGMHHEDTLEDIIKNPIYINNFVSSASLIISAYQLDGIDLDYEKLEITDENAINFISLVKQLKEALPDKIISITLCPDEHFFHDQTNTLPGFSQENLREIAKYATMINLKTHDFFGPHSIVQKDLNKTAFITSVRLPTDAPSNYHLSIDHIVSSAINAGLLPSQLTISIPTYGQALTDIDNKNNGLFNTISDKASIPMGDLDPSDCQTNIKQLSDKSCSGIFQYSFINKHMLGQGFIETNHQLNDLVIGASAYANHWSPLQGSNYDLKITNAGQEDDMAFNVIIGDFSAPDFFNTNKDQTYSSQITKKINGKENLSVKWTTNWGPSGECRSTLNFTKSMHIILKVTPDTIKSQYKTFCSFSALNN